MQLQVSVHITATIDSDKFSSVDAILDHVCEDGNIDHFSITPVFAGTWLTGAVGTGVSTQVSRTSPKKESRPGRTASSPAQPESGGGNAGSVEAVSHTAPPAAGDTGTDGPAVGESASEPARTVSITDIRALASKIMAADKTARTKISALLKTYGVDNMTSLGEKAEALAGFYKALTELDK